MQQRLKKYSRDVTSLAAVASRRITDTSLSIIATIHDYRIIPTSLLTRLVPGHEKNVYRHLQQLYHKGLINRFAFMRNKNPGEFHYYLDNAAALHLLVNHGADPEDLEFEEVSRNRQKAYCDVNDPKRIEEMQGKLLFLKHEVMISRFHAMLELACSQSKGTAELTEFQQGPALWNKVEVPRMVYRDGQWQERDESELLPHRPDAFFTLSFLNRDPGLQAHFFYEADRHRTDTNKYNKKLRAHFHFAVKQKERLKEIYGLNRIRAVLTETVDDEWAERLRQAANHVTVSGPKPSPLFWFTTSRLFYGGSAGRQTTSSDAFTETGYHLSENLGVARGRHSAFSFRSLKLQTSMLCEQHRVRLRYETHGGKRVLRCPHSHAKRYDFVGAPSCNRCGKSGVYQEGLCYPCWYYR